RRETYGGLQTDDPELLAIKNAVYAAQAFQADVDNTNVSGQVTIAYEPSDKVNTFATFSTGYRPVGLNLGGLPRENGQTMLELAVIKPEHVQHYEVGVKAQPTRNVSLGLTVLNTEVNDYQAQVQSADLSVNRGYLANAEHIRVNGVEADAMAKLGSFFSLYASLAYT